MLKCNQIVTRSPNDTGEGGPTKMSSVLFSIFELNFTKKSFKSYVFCEIKIVTLDGGDEPASPNDTWGRGRGGLK